MATRIALEFSIATLNVKLESRVRATRAPSFRTLGPDKKPPVSAGKLLSDGSRKLKDDETTKGVELSSGVYAPLTEEQIELIKDADKTAVLKPRQLVPMESIDLALTITAFNVTWDDKVPGSKRNVELLWNGLKASKLAYVSQATIRGSMDSLLVLYAEGDELRAVKYPFVSELYDVTKPEFEANKKAQGLFKKFVEEQYDAELGEELDHAQFASEFLARRQKVIDTVVAGGEVEIPDVPEAPVGTDLMDVLEGAVKETARKKATPKKKPAAKKPARKKVKA